ncbi:hypothetical protein MNEG_12462, partial [Monoraphidium neglectum]
PALAGPEAAASAEAAPPAEALQRLRLQLEAPAARMSGAGGAEPAPVRPSFSTIAAGLADRESTGHGRARSSGQRDTASGQAAPRHRPRLPAAAGPIITLTDATACASRRVPAPVAPRPLPRARFPAPSDEEQYTAAGAAERWRTLGRTH